MMYTLKDVEKKYTILSGPVRKLSSCTGDGELQKDRSKGGDQLLQAF